MGQNDGNKTIAGSPNYGRTDVRDLNEALRELHGTEGITLERGDPGSALVLSVPNGRTIHSVKRLLDEYLPKPERRVGTAKVFSLDSLIAIIARFGSLTSAVFADPDIAAPMATKKPSITAVFDYHPGNGIKATPDDEEVTRNADWLQHKARYEPQLSDEWKEWMGSNGKLLDQVTFAEFLEEHATSLCVANLDDPNVKTFAELLQGRFADPTQLIELSRSIEVNVGIKVKTAIKLQSGEISVLWDEVHNDGQGAPIKIPNLFQILIPVFYAGEWYRLTAKLRYRASQGSVTWGYEIVQPELAFKGAFDEMVKKVKDESKLPVFLGAPEAKESQSQS